MITLARCELLALEKPVKQKPKKNNKRGIMTPQEESFLDKVTKARRLLLKDYPEFGMTALDLNIIADPSCGVGWVDGINIGFNPNFVELASLDDLIFLWAHESLHVMLLHPFRIGDKDKTLYNMSGDYVINNMCEEAHLKMIKNGLFDFKYSDKTTEEVYDMLQKQQRKEKMDRANNEKPGGDKPSISTVGVGRKRKGKKQTTEYKPPTIEELQKRVHDEVRPCPVDKDEMKKSENAQAIKNTISIQSAKMWGKLPGSILRQIGNLIESKITWQEVLRNYMDNLSRDDYSWRKLDQQYMERDMLVPTLWSETIGEIVVVSDSSGSISNDDLAVFNSEFNACLDVLPSSIVHVMSCDTKVQGEVKEYHSKESNIKLEVKGGGGTNFKPPFEKVEELGIMPAVLIYLTDMECNSFPPEPDYPVLWVKVRNSSYAQKPPFGEVIDIS
jgi:predicted metal-dependent peptidase